MDCDAAQSNHQFREDLGSVARLVAMRGLLCRAYRHACCCARLVAAWACLSDFAVNLHNQKSIDHRTAWWIQQKVWVRPAPPLKVSCQSGSSQSHSIRALVLTLEKKLAMVIWPSKMATVQSYWPTRRKKNQKSFFIDSAGSINGGTFLPVVNTKMTRHWPQRHPKVAFLLLGILDD